MKIIFLFSLNPTFQSECFFIKESLNIVFILDWPIAVTHITAIILSQTRL